MATIKNQSQEDVKNQDGGTPVTGTAGASDAGNPNAGASPVKQNAASQNQSGYTDVGSYLNANQAGSEKMGQDVASNLTNKFNETKQGAAQSANDLINQVNQGYTKENSDVVSKAAADPNAYASNQDLLSQFQGQLNDQYTGPSSWGDYGTQQGKINEATQYGSLANTPGGMNVYAQELEGPMASQGVNQLDSLLLGGNEKSANAIKTAAQPYNTLNDYLDQQNKAATGAIGAGQTAAQNASQNALNAFTGANGTLTNLNSQINQTTAQKLAEAQAQQAAIRDSLGKGEIRAEDFAALGLTPETYSALISAKNRAGTSDYMTGHNFGAASGTQNIDLSTGLQQQDPSQLINAGTIATPEQYQQMASIQALLGSKNPQGNAINPALSSLAGTYNPSQLNQFDASGLTDYANQIADANRRMAQDQANQLTSQADAAHAASKKSGFANTVKNVVNNPVDVLTRHMNPMNTLNDIQNAYKNPGTVPDFNGGSMNPLPNRQEKDKLGVK